MKQEINLPAKYFLFLLIFFISIIILAIFYFIKNDMKYKDEIEVLISERIRGTIIYLKDESRGSYYIEIDDLNTRHKLNSLPIAWEIEKYHVQVGDSVSKEPNSKIITFYKLKDGLFKKNFDFVIRI